MDDCSLQLLTMRRSPSISRALILEARAARRPTVPARLIAAAARRGARADESYFAVATRPAK